MATVLNTGRYPIPLPPDGIELAPGTSAVGVDLDDPQVAAHIDNNTLEVLARTDSARVSEDAEVDVRDDEPHPRPRAGRRT